jgi:RNA polymerase sigma factor (sigma-70 family)
VDLSKLGDAELIRHVVEIPWDAGGSEAFGTLWQRHQGWIEARVEARRNLTPRGCSSEYFCERVLDRVRKNLIQGLPGYRELGSFRAFLRAIIDNAAIDEYRYWMRQPKEVGAQAALGQDADSTLTDEEAMDSVAHRAGLFSPPPSGITEAGDRVQIILRVLELMRRESRQAVKWATALRMHFMGGKTQRAIAEELGVSERQVARWVKDGLEAMKRLLREHFGITGPEDM